MPTIDSLAVQGSPTADFAQGTLLQSIVEVACRVFRAAAASIFLVDGETGDLIFEAVAGEGEGRLVGTRFPSGTGIAGWVATSGQPLLIDNLTESEQFARDAAESTGYVPQSIIAAPLIQSGECIGVVEVLDRGSKPLGDLGDLDLLGLLATETAVALEILVQLRWSNHEAAGLPSAGPSSSDSALLQGIAQRLPRAGSASATVRKLLTLADELLAAENASAASPHG